MAANGSNKDDGAAPGPGKGHGIVTTFDESTGLLREAALAVGGAVVILDTPRYISRLTVHTKCNEGRLNGSTAHG